MTNRANAGRSDTIAKNDDVAWFRSLNPICLDVIPSPFRAGRFPVGVHISNHERANEVTLPESQHRAEYVSATGRHRFTGILILFGLDPLGLCPAGLCHKIFSFAVRYSRIQERGGHPLIDQAEHVPTASAELAVGCF